MCHVVLRCILLLYHMKKIKKNRQKGKYTKIKQVNPYMGHIFAMITIQRRTLNSLFETLFFFFLSQPPYSHTSFSLFLILRPIKTVPPVPHLLITQTPEFTSHIPFPCGRHHHRLISVCLQDCLRDDATSRKKLAKEDNMRGVCLAERCVRNIVELGRRIREHGRKVLHWVSVKPVLLGFMHFRIHTVSQKRC